MKTYKTTVTLLVPCEVEVNAVVNERGVASYTGGLVHPPVAELTQQALRYVIFNWEEVNGDRIREALERVEDQHEREAAE